MRIRVQDDTGSYGAIGGKAWDNDAARHFGVHEIPAIWLLDKSGKIG
jgi:hypothetical protein